MRIPVFAFLIVQPLIAQPIDNERLRAAAQAGDAASQVLLGDTLLKAARTAQERSAAIAWLVAAAEHKRCGGLAAAITYHMLNISLRSA